MNCGTASGHKAIRMHSRNTVSTTCIAMFGEGGKFFGKFFLSYQKTWQCREKNIHFCYAADAGNLFPASAASANTKEYSLGNFISRKTLFGIEKAA